MRVLVASVLLLAASPSGAREAAVNDFRPDEPARVCLQRAEPGALPTPEGTCFAAFEGRVSALDAVRRRRMVPVVWREGCPVPLEGLRVVEVAHWTLAGEVARGEIVVAARVAPAVLGVFRRLWEARFPVARMEPIEAFDGDDDRSMAANNTSAFNCRTVSGTGTFSRHAFGEAIDLNPLQNPWVRGHRVEPPEGRRYADRSLVEPGVIVDGGPAVRAFEAAGWKWGGRWSRTKDWQHFSTDGS